MTQEAENDPSPKERKRAVFTSYQRKHARHTP